MILDYPDHTLLFPKKGGNSDAVSVQTDTVQVSSFFFFRLYITQPVSYTHLTLPTT